MYFLVVAYKKCFSWKDLLKLVTVVYPGAAKKYTFIYLKRCMLKILEESSRFPFAIKAFCKLSECILW